MTNLNSIKVVQISFPNTNQLLNLSHGEILNTNTINYKTLKPITGGLFCAKIFGSIKDNECLCGYYKGIQFLNKLCPKCHTTVTSMYTRRRRLGHIKLVSHVIHPWALGFLIHYLILLLPIKKKDLQIYLKTNEIGLYILLKKFLNTNGGTELLKLLLATLDLVSIFFYSKIKILNFLKKKNTLNYSLYFKILKIHKLIKSFLSSNTKPDYIIFNTLLVLPPDLRPLVLLKNNFFITSDLNYLYRRIIHRNDRLKQLKYDRVPINIVHLEKKILQDSIDALFENEKLNNPILNNKKQPLKSLSQRLQGKEGRFRHNLLGKRVNYSGRSVIIVGPKLKLNQCGIPLYIVMELFKPFIQYKIKNWLKQNFSFIKKEKIKTKKTFTFFLIQFINLLLSTHPILLNRAPTLHRLNIQSFEGILIHLKAIQLHPLVCAAFNADFDGDQMAVHLPITLESKVELKFLMHTSKNILSPANGAPIISPTQDIIFGLYYATLENMNFQTVIDNKVISSSKIKYLLDQNILNIHSTIYTYIYEYTQNLKPIKKKIKSTVGKILLYNIIPIISNKKFSLVDKTFSKKETMYLIKYIYDISIENIFRNFLDKLMAYGFYYAYKAGLSISLYNFVVPSVKKKIIPFFKTELNYFIFLKKKYLITEEKHYRNIIRIWDLCLQTTTLETIKDVIKKTNLKSSLYISIDSGSRGSNVQLRQLSHFRGLMVKASGEIVNNPITSNFLEGLSVLEYFDSIHGSRKGVIDTSLKTANAGYLTRKLIYANHYSLINSKDCGTENGILITAVIEKSNTLLSLYDQIYGRITAKDIIDPTYGNVLIYRNQLLNYNLISLIKKKKIESLYIRSPITCKQSLGICQKCYGLDLTTQKYPFIGLPVGVLAAQSIGEPGTQLTMRTFHQGGILQGSYEETLIKSFTEGRILIKKNSILNNSSTQKFLISERTILYLINSNSQTINSYDIPYGAQIYVEDGEYVTKNSILASWDSEYFPIISTISGIIENKNILLNTINIQLSAHSKKYYYIKDIATYFKANNYFYFFNKNTMDLLFSKKSIDIGNILGYLPRYSSLSTDITGDLYQVSKLFENSTLNLYPLFPSNGYIFYQENINENLVNICHLNNDNKKIILYSNISKKDLLIRPFEYVEKGSSLLTKSVSLSHILTNKGFKQFIMFFMNSIQTIYLNQGVNINNKYFEIVLSQMIREIKIFDSNNHIMIYEELDKLMYYKKNLISMVTGEHILKKKIVLKGLSQSTLLGPSFIASASFQRTSKILSESAFFNKIDYILGLQENVILGRLIPAGTGFYLQ